ncbi:hypothetical protein CB1_001218001, partial [Camelus ferus]
MTLASPLLQDAFLVAVSERAAQFADAEKASELAEREEVAYDPEDQTILAEAEVTIHGVPNRMCADKHGSGMGKPTGFATSISAPSMAEKEKMTGELNKQFRGPPLFLRRVSRRPGISTSRANPPPVRLEAGPKEKPLEEPEAPPPDSRRGPALGDRRQERELGNAGGGSGRNLEQERDWDRGREWDRHRDKDAGREWDSGRERSCNRDHDRRRDRERSRSMDRDRDRDQA